jgi:hypothetical protein
MTLGCSKGILAFVIFFNGRDAVATLLSASHGKLFLYMFAPKY